MSAVAEIEKAISHLSVQEAKAIREWQEDQREIAPEFLASIERGKADLAAGRAFPAGIAELGR